MKHIDNLVRYLDKWQQQLNTIVKGRGSRIDFPTGFSIVEADGMVRVSLPHPVCIHDAPQKGSSRKRGPSHRLTIAIDGGFSLSPSEAHPCLLKANASVAFYEFLREGQSRARLVLVDCAHFDFEHDKKPFHPVFHVQRGMGIDSQRCRELVSKHRHIAVDQIDIDEAVATTGGTPYLRVPSPQMDVFAVLAMIVADYFCGEDDEQSDKKTLYAQLLRLLANDTNVVRECNPGRALRGTIGTMPFMSAAYWYPEWA